jgi:hypothetical protein
MMYLRYPFRINSCLGCVREILSVLVPVNCVNMAVVCFEVLRSIFLVLLVKSVKSVRGSNLELVNAKQER